MKILGPQDRQSGRLLLDEDALRYVCTRCKSEHSKYSNCPVCKDDVEAVLKCAMCGGKILEEKIEYSATGKLGGSVIKQIDAFYCANCNIYSNSNYWISQIEELSNCTKEELHFLSETGIYSKSALEVFVVSYKDYDANDLDYTIVKRFSGIKVRYGEQSKLFQEALNMITNYDTEDFGHSYSSTLKITPGPPYNDSQRSALQVLLSRIQNELGHPLVFWSTHFRLQLHEEEKARRKKLSKLLMTWKPDNDRQALTLHNKIISDSAPGKFFNVFRLLELVLQRMLDEDIIQKRKDRSVSQKDFQQLVFTYGTDLKTRLRRRIEALHSRPKYILQKLWNTVEPNRSINYDEIYDCIVKFRNKYAHRPGESIKITLPWEEPDFDEFIDRVLELITAILEDRVKV